MKKIIKKNLVVKTNQVTRKKLFFQTTLSSYFHRVKSLVLLVVPLKTVILMILVVAILGLINILNHPFIKSSILADHILVKHPNKTTITSKVQPSFILPVVSQVITSSIHNFGVPVLYYHYIEINPNPIGDPRRSNLLITPNNFESQLLYLKNHGYTTISLDQLMAGLKGTYILPAKPVVLTIDDGYEDFYQNAWPLVQKYNVQVTLFVTSDGSIVPPIGGHLTDVQIKTLSESTLITIADHTVSHPDLAGKSLAYQEDQILSSQKYLENLIGKQIKYFAYPYGAYDRITLKVLQMGGYTAAFTTSPGIDTPTTNSYLMHRIRIGNYGGLVLGEVLNNYH